MPDHILRVTVRADDMRHYFVDLEIDGDTYAVLGPYDDCPSDDEANAAALACVRFGGYRPNAPIIWLNEN